MSKKTRRAKTRRVLFTLSLVLVMMMVAVGGTIAWLTANTESITNTFTTSTIEIGLSESENLDLQMVPGHTITKDPKVTVDTNSEACYVFVKVDYVPGSFVGEDGTFTYDVLDFDIATDWTQLDNTTNANVYYRTWKPGDASNEFIVISGNTVTVDDELTKQQMNAMTAETGALPTITVQAFACQLYQTNGTEFEPAAAWAIAKP